MKLADLKGKKFDKLLVLGIDENNKYNASGKIQWKCQCDCGNIHYASQHNLKNGDVMTVK